MADNLPIKPMPLYKYHFPLYFSDGRAGSLVVPQRMTLEDRQLLQAQIADSLSVIDATTFEVVVMPEGVAHAP